MMLIMFISTLMNSCLMLSSHPILIMMLVLIQSFFICLFSWISMKMSWISFILFLIFLGGLMILFIYVTSLASNEKFELKSQSNWLMFTFFSMAVIFTNLNYSFIQLNYTFIYSLNLMFSMFMMLIIIMVMNYLLFTLIVVVKLTQKFNGPIRNMIY
uniref:NADH-ubiquinone oxidoreductase chain 6 n=1 Tax=Seira pallidipes TaxID=3053390 RepID=A0AAU6QDL2_9HEXA